MKRYVKLSALAAVLVASATFASAATITFASGVSTTYYNGYTAGNGAPYNDVAPVFGGTDFAGGANTATISIGTGGGVWEAPIAGSSWISFENTQPGQIVVPNGYYEFTTSFTTTGGLWAGTISVEADDTVAVYNNGVLLLDAGLIGGDGHCSDGTPNCATITTFNFGSMDAGFNNNGTNTLTFIVEQTGLSAMGLDYSGSVSSVPEPSSLLLLGTGLIGSAGAMFRRMRK